MEINRKSFVFYFEWWENLAELSEADLLKTFEAIINYAKTKEEPELKGIPAMAFKFIKGDLDRDLDKYLRRVKANRENGRLGGRPRENETNPNNPMGLLETQPNPTKPKKPDNDNVDDNVDDDVDDNVDANADADADDNINVDAILSSPIDYLVAKYPTEYRERITPKLENLIPKSEQGALMIKYCARVVLKIQNGELQPQKESLFAYLIGFITSWRQHNDNYKRKLESAGRI